MIENMPELINIILLATVAGFISSVLGGIIVICINMPSKKFIGLSLVFTSSVLLALAFIDFLPHAIGHGHYHTAIDPVTGTMYQYWHQHNGAGIWLTVLGISIGVGLVFILGLFDKFGHEHVHGVLPHTENCSHNPNLTKSDRKRIISTAFPVTLAIILHDLPKGLAIGSSGSVLASILIGLSCIPEGMSIAIPLKAGGEKWWKILGVCGLAGLATIIGAVIGYLIGGINVYLSGLMFAIATGCILAVVFSEIMPIAMKYSESTKLRLPVMLISTLLVLILSYFFHDLMH